MKQAVVKKGSFKGNLRFTSNVEDVAAVAGCCASSGVSLMQATVSYCSSEQNDFIYPVCRGHEACMWFLGNKTCSCFEVSGTIG